MTGVIAVSSILTSPTVSNLSHKNTYGDICGYPYNLYVGISLATHMRKDGIYMYKENRTKTLEQKVLELQCIVLRCLH